MIRTTIIATLLALAGCNDNPNATDDSSNPATSLDTLDPETSASDDSSSSGDGSDGSDGSDSSDTSEGASTTDGDSSESTGEPECSDPGAAGMHEACGPACENACADGLTCRTSFVGGYLAECTSECTTGDECSSGACSNGWCILPCGPDGECAEGTYCYPGTSPGSGEPVIDPNHPDRHCMPHVL